ncbi:MAG: hypothetical protein IE926_18615 [Micrococcales bacterium]|nr:hypothetical protein [Micrococcales bacterium]
MATATRVDAAGFTRCERCGVRFKSNHSCRSSALDGYMPRRPPGFQDLVDEAHEQHLAEQAAAAQLTFDDVAMPCGRCGRTDLHVDDESGLCTSCLAADARALKDRVADWYGPRQPGRPPP